MEKQIVVFELGREQFGIDIEAVDGIVKMQQITKLPYSPAYMEGVTNLRGSVLPVIDLRKRLDLPVEEETKETRIIIINTNSLKMGMIVSAVTEVLTIDEMSIETSRTITTNVKTDFIIGIAKVDARLVILLDLSKVLFVKDTITVSHLLEI